MFNDFIILIIDTTEEVLINFRDYLIDTYETLKSKIREKLKSFLEYDNMQIVVDYKVEELFFLMREYLSIDSQFTKWIATVTYDFLNVQERKFFRKLYKKKLKMRKQIESKQKDIGRSHYVTSMER